jgi:hypothetical protein
MKAKKKKKKQWSMKIEISPAAEVFPAHWKSLRDDSSYFGTLSETLFFFSFVCIALLCFQIIQTAMTILSCSGTSNLNN